MVSIKSELSKNAITNFLNICKREIEKGNVKFIDYRFVKVKGVLMACPPSFS